MAGEKGSKEAGPGEAGEADQRLQQLKAAEGALKKTRDELARHEEDLRQKALDLKAVMDDIMRREDQLTSRERQLAQGEDELLKGSSSAVAAAIESQRRTLDEREAKVKSEERELKHLAEKLQKREEEYNIRVRSFNAEAEGELRGRVQELAKKEAEAARLDKEARAMAEETARREEALIKREKEASERWQDIARREEDLKHQLLELERRTTEAEKHEKEAVSREEAALEAGALKAEGATEGGPERHIPELTDAGLKARDEKQRARAEELAAQEERLRTKEAELKGREEALGKELGEVDGEEETAKELAERAQMLADRERAVEQFNQELLALDAILKKKGEEQAANEKLLVERAEALEGGAETMGGGKERLAKDREALLAEKEALLAKMAELDRAQNAHMEKEEQLKAEEERVAVLTDEMAKKNEEIRELEKDLRYKEIHLLTLEDEIKDCPYCSAQDGFVATMQAIAEAKALGAGPDVAEAEKFLKQAKATLETSSLEGAVQWNKKALVLAREAKQKYLVHGVTYILSGARAAVRAAAEAGVDVTGAERLLEQSRAALDRSEFEAAESLARKAERTAILAEEKVRELTERLDKADRRLEEIGGFGVDLGEAQATVLAARELMKEKRLSDARTAVDGVEEVAFLAFRRRATQVLDETREAISKQRAAGSDTGESELFLAKAEERLAEGDYGKCIQSAREAFRLAMEKRPQHPKEGQPGMGAHHPEEAPGGERYARLRPRVVASTVTTLTPEARPHAGPGVISGGLMAQGAAALPAVPKAAQVQGRQMAAGQAPASGALPVATLTPSTGLAAQSLMDRSPRGIPLQLPSGGGVPRDYQCPACHGYFSVEDARRPVLTKCPSCLALVKLT